MQLPPEIVLNGILSYLSVHDVLSCSEVCSDLYVLCFDQHLWKQLYHRDYNIYTPDGLKMLEKVGYSQLYQYYYDLTKIMYMYMGIRTEQTSAAMFSDPIFVTYCITCTDASIGFIQVTLPVILELDFEMEEPGYGGYFSFHNKFETYSARKLHEQFNNKEISRQEVQEVVEDLTSDGYYRTKSGGHGDAFEPGDETTRKLLDFGLIVVPGLEKLPSSKMRNLLDYGIEMLSYDGDDDVEGMWKEELTKTLEEARLLGD